MASQSTAHTHPYGGNGPTMLIVSFTEAAVAVIVLTLRFYARTLTGTPWTWDMFWVAAAGLLGLVAQALVTAAALYGVGNHQADVNPETIGTGLLCEWIFNICTIMSTGFGKFAIVALLLQIQGRTHPKKRYFLFFVAGTTMFLDVFQSILVWFQCEPIHKLWDVMAPGSCKLQKRILSSGVFQGSWSATSDFALAIYPVFVFWGLNASWKMRLGLCGLFLGGAVAGVAAILKTMYILTLTAQQDVIFAISPLIIWAATEMWLIIIMGSIPPLRTLLVRFFRRVGETISHSIHTSKHSQSNSVQLSRIRNNGKHHERDTSSQERMTNYEGEYIVMSKSADGVPERGYDNRAIHVTTQVEIKHVNDVEKGFDEGLGRLRMPEHRL